MFKFTYRIAEITFRAESNTRITDLEKARFNDFVTTDQNVDIFFSHRAIRPNSLHQIPIKDFSAPLVKYVEQFAPEQQRLILSVPEIIPVLENCLAYPEEVLIEILPKFLSITDFAQHQVHQFSFVDAATDGSPVRLGSSLISRFLFDFDAIMVHSSSVAFNGKGAMFLAPNEGGKTTVSRLAPPGAVVLADDQNIIRQKDEQFYVYGTPWALISNSQVRATFGGIFILKQDTDFGIKPISSHHAIEFMWGEYRFAWNKLPKERKMKALEMVQAFCKSVPVYLMSFPKGYVDWDLIFNALR